MRVAIPIVVLDTTGAPKSGASVAVKKRSDNSDATVYQNETGGTTVANPLSTSALGRVAGWVERGAYNLVVTGSGITGFTEPFDAAPASDAAADAAWLAAAVLPLGAIMPYGGSADPSGGAWLLCDGRAISRSTYAALFAILGTAFGTGDGSTTFNIPDLRGRVALGAGTASPAVAGGTAHTLAAKGGEEKHTLTVAEMPAHDHSPAPTVDVRGGNGETGVTGGVTPLATNAAATGTKALFIPSEGADTPHNILPPHTVLNHIVRVA